MDKFLLGLLVVFGIIGMINVSSGLKCYQCMQAPGQADEFTYGGCSSLTEEPTAEGNVECTGEHSDIAKKGIKEVVDNGGAVLNVALEAAQAGGVPTCVLAHGKYDGKVYIVRECASINAGTLMGKCITKGDITIKDKKVTETFICGCNSDGCNGKNDTATITVAPTEATTPEKTNKPQTTDNSDNTDGTTMMTPSATTFILGAIFFVYAKLFY